MKNYYEVPAVSNSGMGSINPDQGGTPARYKRYIVDRKKPEDSTPSLENGKLVHLYVEDPKAFVISDVERPSGMIADWVDETFNQLPEFWTTEYIKDDNITLKKLALRTRGDRYKSMIDEVKIWSKFKEGFPYLKHLFALASDQVITSSQKAIVTGCIDSLKANKAACKYLFDKGDMFGDESFNELAVYWDESVSVGHDLVILNCKGLLDRVNVYHSEKRIELVDLKTTGKPIAKFEGSFEYYRYYRQMAWYTRAIKEHFGEDWEIGVIMVVVETTGLYETKVFSVDKSWLDRGMVEAMDLCDRIAYAQHHKEWVLTTEEIAGNGIINLKL